MLITNIKNLWCVREINDKYATLLLFNITITYLQLLFFFDTINAEEVIDD